MVSGRQIWEESRPREASGVDRMSSPLVADAKPLVELPQGTLGNIRVYAIVCACSAYPTISPLLPV